MRLNPWAGGMWYRVHWSDHAQPELMIAIGACHLGPPLGRQRQRLVPHQGTRSIKSARQAASTRAD